MKKTNILYVNQGHNYFGAEHSLYYLLKYLDKSTYSPIVLLPTICTYKDRFSEIGVDIREMDIAIPLKIKNIFKIIAYNLKLCHFIRRHNITLVHVNVFAHSESLLPFFLFLKLVKVKYIFHIRSCEIFSALERFIIFRGHVICVSNYVKTQFFLKRKSDFITMPHMGKFKTVYNGIELSPFMDSYLSYDIKNEFGITNEKVVGFIGAIDPVKDVELFLLTAKIVKERFSSVKFLVVGDIYDNMPKRIDYRSKVFSMTAELGIKKEVIFTGYRNDIPSLLKIMDIFVLTSKSEGQSGVLIEAMASAKPTVAAAVGGCSEIISDNVSGFLVHSRNPCDYADRILTILNDDNKKNEMGTAGRRIAIETFAAKRGALGVQEVYKNIIHNNDL